MLAPAARHGLAALERFRDRDHGGFFTRVDLKGQPIGGTDKATHVQAYALAALSELARFAPLGDDGRADASRAARETFDWIERHAALHGGGYRSALARDGAALPYDPNAVDPPRDGFGVPGAWRDFGTQLHLLAAYTALLRVTPEAGDLRARVEGAGFAMRTSCAGYWPPTAASPPSMPSSCPTYKDARPSSQSTNATASHRRRFFRSLPRWSACCPALSACRPVR